MMTVFLWELKLFDSVFDGTNSRTCQEICVYIIIQKTLRFKFYKPLFLSRCATTNTLISTVCMYNNANTDSNNDNDMHTLEKKKDARDENDMQLLAS